jgi:fatty-acyl-CoA synthase
MTTAIDWPTYDSPDDLREIESTPLAERNLPASTYELLVRAAELWPSKEAVKVLPSADQWEEPFTSTFAELLREVHRAANQLHRVGVRRLDAVTILSPNCAELIPAILAAELAGIAAPINPSLSVDHIGELLRRSGSRVLIAAGPELDPEAWQTARGLAAAGSIDVLIALRPTNTAALQNEARLPDAGCATVAYFCGDENLPTDRFEGTPPRAEDLASLFHTGGTTGLPKLAAHTHANEVSNAWMIAANTLLGDDAVVFAALPLFHVNALVVTLLAPLYKGQTVLWAGPLGYRDAALYGYFWKVVETYRISAMSAVPTVYSVLAQCPIDADISTMRLAMVGASALPQAVRSDFESHTGVTLVEGYGLTEATCASARSFPSSPRPGSVGQRLPYQDVQVVRVGDDGARTPLPHGDIGTLAISGPCVFPGYVVGRDNGRLLLDGLGKLADGWLDTGDLARMDEDGFIYLTGRAKDLIIRGGHNIDPASIEDIMLSHPAVSAAAAVGRPDAHAGEVPVAYVVASEGVSAGELRAWAAERVAEKAAAPRSVTLLDALPVTDVGKPYKLALRAMATQDAIAEALAGVHGVASVSTQIEDGSVIAIVDVHADTDEGAIDEVLGRFAVPWKVSRR